MKRRVSVQMSTPQLTCAGLVAAAVVAMSWPLGVKIVVIAVAVVLALIAVDDRLASRWVVLAIRNRRRARLPVKSQAELGAVALPGEDVAVRWEGDDLVALVNLHPRPFTPTIVVDGKAVHDDVVDSARVEDILSRCGFDVSGDIVSAGWRVAHSAPAAVYGQCEQVLGQDPSPGFRRSWIVVRVCPMRLPVSVTRWRGGGVVGAANALVAAASRLAEDLSTAGVDARLARSFGLFDELTDVEVVEQQWSAVRHSSSYTTVFSAAGGPDQWWSVRAVRTVTRMRVVPGHKPRSVVALTTVRPIDRDPDGWVRLRGTQLEALAGYTPVVDQHHRLPVGSAGVLIGRTVTDQCPVYVPFDAVESVLQYAEPALLVQAAFRAAAAGATVSLPPGYAAAARGLGGVVDEHACIEWPSSRARTWLVPQQVPHVIAVSQAMIVLPRGRIPIEPVRGREDAVIGAKV